jgi:long-chain fatty acid transport protein
MRKLALVLLNAVGLSFATNGDLLIGVGAVSRSMGGVGISLPTDADSTIFSNPALMGEYQRATLSFGGTLFMPHTKGCINGSCSTSDAKYFAIPSIGIVYPLNQRWVFGISAYGVSGMGVDYRNTDIKCNPNSPGCYTNFQSMELSPSVAYRVNGKLSVGFGLDLAYGALDLGAGLSSDYAAGAQIGVYYKVNPSVGWGAIVKTPLRFNFARVADFNGDGILDDMTLEQPWVFGTGIGVKPLQNLKVALEVMYIPWSDAKGYKDFGWKDQWVFKVGGEYQLTQKLSLRAGYNYGKSPVRGESFNTTNPALAGAECMKIIGFPAIAEHHLSLGVGYRLSPKVRLDFSYMHAFENSVQSVVNGNVYKSKLSEDSLSMGITWSF